MGRGKFYRTVARINVKKFQEFQKKLSANGVAYVNIDIAVLGTVVKGLIKSVLLYLSDLKETTHLLLLQVQHYLI